MNEICDNCKYKVLEGYQQLICPYCMIPWKKQEMTKLSFIANL